MSKKTSENTAFPNFEVSAALPIEQKTSKFKWDIGLLFKSYNQIRP